MIEGNRFAFWVRDTSASYLLLQVNATSADGRQIARRTIHADEIRQAAIDGLKLQMEKPERSVAVTVVENGRTVPDAVVAAEFEENRVTDTTNGAGVATFLLMKRDELSQLTAWTKDFKVGGYSLYRDPKARPAGRQIHHCLGPVSCADGPNH